MPTTRKFRCRGAMPIGVKRALRREQRDFVADERADRAGEIVADDDARQPVVTLPAERLEAAAGHRPGNLGDAALELWVHALERQERIVAFRR